MSNGRLRSPYAEALAGPQIVEELRGVNAKLESLDEKLDTIHTDMNAGFTTLAGLMRQMLERLDRVVDRAKGVRRV